MENIFQDIRYSLRTLIKNPGFALVAVLVLALGIAANTAIFSAVNAILLRSLPYHDADRLVVPVTTHPGRNIDRGSVAFADYLDWKKEEQIFENVAAFDGSSLDMTGAGEPQRVQGAFVTEEYFDVMGAAPLIGRTFAPDDKQPGASPGLVMSYALWQRHFGGDQGVIGQPLTINGRPYTVIGVMPKDSQWPATTDLWAILPVGLIPQANLMRRDNQVWRSIARLKPGVSVEQATTVMQTIARRVEQDEVSKAGWSARAMPLHEYIVGSRIQTTLLVLFAAVGFVLLIACVNVANLLLARSAARSREMAIRVALGAGRLRLVRQLLTESLVLSFLGGVIGVVLSLWLKDLLITFGPSDIPRLNEITIDTRVLLFAVGASLLTALLFGMIPALQATKTDLNESLKEGGRASTDGPRRRRIRSLLVVLEIALSLVLLIGAGLVVRSFARLQQVDPGFNVENLLTMTINLSPARYRTGEQVADAGERILSNLRSQPGVESASAATALPLGAGGFYLGRVFLIEGHPEPPAAPDHPAQWNVITPTYFETLRIPVIKGRVFTERDTATSTPVIVINETLARTMFPGEDPIGKRIRSWRDENKLREIVGIVKDVRYFGRDDELRGLVFVPHRQDSWRALVLAIRTTGDPSSMAEPARDQIWAIDKDMAIADVLTMEKALDDSVAPARFQMMLLGLFGLLALTLAAVGIYGMLSYSVAQRSHEIGVRMALGARSGDVLKMVVRQGMTLTFIGVGIGLIGSFAVTRLMSSLLYEISALDPWTFSIISLMLVAVAFFASYIPARRATRVDPMVALRYE
jgi:putative ABC transport system permease protein